MTIEEYKGLSTEHDECVRLVWYLDQLKDDGKILHYTKVPNETYTESWKQKHKNKLEGVNPGFPDYIIATQRELVFLEMKRPIGGVLRDNQKEWQRTLERLGFKSVVCHGFAEAEAFLEGVTK